MQNNIKFPNLPDHDVGLVLIKNERKTAEALRALGVTVLSPAKSAVLDEEAAEHADMLCCYTGDGRCVLSPDQRELKAELETHGFTVLFSSPLQRSYPGDVALNVALTEKCAIGNFDHTDKALLNCINNKNKIYIKQGYAKCSLCVVSENAFITEDEGAAAALRKNGMNVLLISAGDVELSEKHTGFFGGSTGKLGKNRLAVNGSLRHHRDGEAISAFLRENGVEAIELFDGQIKDIGGILPLKEVF